jgi:hypothetical protein
LLPYRTFTVSTWLLLTLFPPAPKATCWQFAARDRPRMYPAAAQRFHAARLLPGRRALFRCRLACTRFCMWTLAYA